MAVRITKVTVWYDDSIDAWRVKYLVGNGDSLDLPMHYKIGSNGSPLFPNEGRVISRVITDLGLGLAGVTPNDFDFAVADNSMGREWVWEKS